MLVHGHCLKLVVSRNLQFPHRVPFPGRTWQPMPFQKRRIPNEEYDKFNQTAKAINLYHGVVILILLNSNSLLPKLRLDKTLVWRRAQC